METETNATHRTITNRVSSPVAAIAVEHQPGGEWKITATADLTDEQAGAITFRAAPEQVRLGRFVAVHDPSGQRIGHVSAASYHESWTGPAYVVVSIALR